MKPVRDSDGHLVCRIDERTQTVEILHKGVKTTIRFSDGHAEVSHKK